MAGGTARYAKTAFTADGTTTGYITLASNVGYYVSAEVSLNSGNQVAQNYIITDLPDSTRIGLRVKTYGAGPVPVSFGRTDVSAYTLAQSAYITQPQQMIFSGYNLPPPTTETF